MRPGKQDGDETTRIEMDNVSLNVQMPHRVDTLPGDATAPEITTQAEKSALADASVEKESNPQKTEMQENQGGDLRQPDPTKPGDYRAMTGPAKRNSKYEV